MNETIGSTRPPPPSGEEGERTGGLGFPVVGLGASAGGIQALLRFFEALPDDSGMAFVIILHLSPNHESSAHHIIQRATRMPVAQVVAPVSIQKNHVYVIAPTLNLEMVGNYLRVTSGERPRDRQIAIDLFFRTLAEAHGSRSMAVVLSGTGADGSVGLARVKEHGGVTFAQLPQDAEYEDMPRGAIGRGIVDFVLPAVDIPQKLIDVWAHASSLALLPVDGTEQLEGTRVSLLKRDETEDSLADVLRLLTMRTGHDFRHYKRATVLRRIARRMQVTGYVGIVKYLAYLEREPEETTALLGDMLIGVTNFFRDREAFAVLERDIIPQIISDRKDEQQDEIRVWSAACSTGEEAYTLAMLLTAEAETQRVTTRLQVFATDVDERAIAVARHGVYPEAISADVPVSFLRTYFVRNNGQYQISKRIRDRVLFAPHNILHDPPFSRLQLITCRNLLIYLDRRAQAEVLRTFHSVLSPGGFLFLGASETADAADELFVAVDKKNRIYRALPHRRTQRLPLNSRSAPGAFALKPQVAYELADRRVTYANVHMRALAQFSLPTILVDHAFQIVHTSPDAVDFLRHAGGDPTHNLLSLINPVLRLNIRSAALDAIKGKQPVVSRPAWMQMDGLSVEVRVTVKPYEDKDCDKPLLLLVFERILPSESEVPDDEAVGGNVEDAGSRGRLVALNNEIASLRRQLQETIEHSDISTDELRSSNEELQAMNEELRSATEEHETSKEELQSINEELITVNYELKVKVEETAKINDDLQNLISSSDIATVFVDREMRVKWFTPKTSLLFNLISSDVGRSLMDITHRLDYPEMMADAGLAFESLRVLEREIQSNENRWYLVKILPYRTVEDRIEGAVLNFVDVTDRRQAQERLQSELERTKLVTDSTMDFAIITMNRAGQITSWNQAASIMFGYSAAEVEGRSLEFLFTEEDRANGVPEMELRSAREHGHAEDERWHLRKDGSRFYCSGVVHPLVDGELHGYAKIARDMTDKRLDEYVRDAALERTRAASLMKDEFIAVMSHELRHPLNLIQLNIELISRMIGSNAAPIVARALNAVRGSVRSQSQIIEDLMDLSRVQTGKLKLNLMPVVLNATISSIVQAVRSQAIEQGVQFDTSGIDDGAPHVVLDADPTRVEQIIWNLLNNAVKFTPAGGRVALSLVEEGKFAKLEVTDSGIGLSPEALETIFEMFGQVTRSHVSHSHSGLGIGLALVKQLVEAHNGRIAATSGGEGRGATFTVWLPLPYSRIEMVDGTNEVSVGQLDGVKMLLVDDSIDVTETMGALCEMEGAEVMIANDGPSALALLAQHDFDVVVSDIGMPGMDGYELLNTLRRSARNARTPALALTGYGQSDKVFAAGFTDQLCKPAPMAQVLSKIKLLTNR